MVDDTRKESKATAKPLQRGAAPILRRISYGLILAGIVVVARLAYVGSAVDEHHYAADELVSGPRTQVISWPGGDTGIQINQRMSAHADRVWEVVQAQERLSEFMPYVTSAVEKNREGNTCELDQVLTLPHATYHNRLRMQETIESTRRALNWQQLDGPAVFNQGNWIVEPDGDGSILRYQLSVRVWGVPQWLSNYLMLGRLRRITDAVEARALRLTRPSSEA